MKKNVLALSIAAMIGGLGFAGAASAGVIDAAGATNAANAAAASKTLLRKANIGGFAVADGGVGHILTVPYYTVQNGNMSVIHLVNTDLNNGKVTKIRFRGAANSDDVLDFYILLSPGDVWTGALTKGADGLAQLTTADNTCTVPALTAGVSQSFKTGRLDPALTGDALAAQTREGYVEIFNAADIPSDKIWGAGNDANSALYTAIKHVSGKAPCTSSVLNAALFDTNITTQGAAAALGLDTPTGGLLSDWYIINVAQSTTFSGTATALVGNGGTSVADGVARGNFIVFPQNDSIKIATPESFTADPLLVSAGYAGRTKAVNGAITNPTTLPVIEAIALDFPDLSTPYYAAPSATAALAQASLLTKALAVKSVTNEYAKDPSISAKTDWVFSMPTRRYSVALDYAANGTTTGKRVYSPVSGSGTASPAATVAGAVVTPPAGDAAAIEFFYTGNTSLDGNKICVNSQGVSFRDREETALSGTPVFSPSSASTTAFCGETSVLSFADGVTGVSVLGAAVARQDVSAASIFVNGWGRIDTSNGTVGLPIQGYSVIKLTNPQASANTVGTYGLLFPHRFSK